ncbi:MAG: hypothetical protein KAX44_08190 [Candidatus Brocadiae bacterium]|nr:hypothetical protein [Candidatus Brocadiia bacterium]
MRTISRWVSLLAVALLVMGAGHGSEPSEKKKQEAQLLAPDGVPYDNKSSFDVMQMKALTGNLLQNGSFETGRYWPHGWQATDGLTTFWGGGGTGGKRCLRIYTDVLDAQWKARETEVRAAVDYASRRTRGNPQSLPRNPIPGAPERIPTSPPYYDTVAGLHGVHYRSHYVTCKPGAIYRFSVDARTDAEGEPKVFIKGFFDQKMKTADGYQTVRRDAYRAPIFLDPCDDQWRRYARTFHPSRSKSTLDGKPVKTEHLQVQIYAYWKPGNYYFDNVLLDIVGMEEPEEEKKAEEPGKAEPAKKKETPEPGEDEFPVFDP